MPSILSLLAIVMVVTIGYMLSMRALRRFATRVKQAPPPPSFDMAELQSMLDGGLITQEEFERLKGMMLAQRARYISMQKLKGFEVIPMAKPHDPQPKNEPQADTRS